MPTSKDQVFTQPLDAYRGNLPRKLKRSRIALEAAIGLIIRWETELKNGFTGDRDHTRRRADTIRLMLKMSRLTMEKIMRENSFL